MWEISDYMASTDWDWTGEKQIPPSQYSGSLRITSDHSIIAYTLSVRIVCKAEADLAHLIIWRAIPDRLKTTRRPWFAVEGEGADEANLLSWSRPGCHRCHPARVEL